MEDRWLHRYIYAGCLQVDFEKLDILNEDWGLLGTGQWRYLSSSKSDQVDTDSVLPWSVQEALLRARILAPFVGLFNAQWIQLSYQLGIIRVYIFPHDLDHRVIGRGREGKLNKAMSALLKQLDYSPHIWHGSSDSSKWSHPKSSEDQMKDDENDVDDISLLDRFNSLPSPEPHLDAMTPDSLNALAMQGILESNLAGLHTSLFPHQRRSAALMLQREAEPGRMIDPRLRHAIDHRNQRWYLDEEAGVVLREPRYYDGTPGGILAEEMGTGKTLICLSLILATKHLPAEPPEPLIVDRPIRHKVGSLLDMAAAAVNRHSYPWRLYLASQPSESGEFYDACVKALESYENRAFYELRNPLVEARASSRIILPPPPATKIHLSSISLIIVPTNLVTQWLQEIKKHTSGLKVLTLTDLKSPIPPVTILLTYDIILFSQVRFERIEQQKRNTSGRDWIPSCPLEFIRFKRCIIDEGHKLGTRGGQWRSDLMRGLDRLEIAARWVVTGTPSRGLYGVGAPKALEGVVEKMKQDEAIYIQEREDLQRIGNIASKFLKVRPWSNTRDEVGDTPAEWNVYVMQPQHHARSCGRRDCLKMTLENLIIRNRLSDITHHLPSVDEKVILLNGSYQDKLSLNLFSMMIIFNSVQSQRTDQDYFFHPRQRKSLMQLVQNLKQASFFGGVFFSREDIAKSLQTAEEFLEKKEVSISVEDRDLLKNALEFGKIATQNRLKDVSNQFHAMPLFLEHFPGGDGKHWSLDYQDSGNGPLCTDASLISALQRFLNPCIDAPTSLELMIENGQLAAQGDSARERALTEATETSGGVNPGGNQSSSLAGNAALGRDHHSLRKSSIHPPAEAQDTTMIDAESVPTTGVEIAEQLAKTQIISTVSAKLSYLIDSIIKHQNEEQIIVFYENDNVAYYLAGALEILQIQHLIYTRRGLDAKRRAQYISTFTYNPKFRVLLMDITQAAFGLDMKSASRIYFVSPVLNPQVEAQAIGRARRISQQKPVSVETLVLRDSIEEVIVERRKNMTQAEHRKIKNILDDKPIYNWILNPKITPLPTVEDDVAQTSKLKIPQYVFGRGFGRESHPDEELITESPDSKSKKSAPETTDDLMKPRVTLRPIGVLKRSRPASPAPVPIRNPDEPAAVVAPPPAIKKARFAFAD